jgi:hypothetical protein
MSLVKRLLPLLAGTLATLVNTSLCEGVFPDALKRVIVRPRLKKMTLNPDDVNSYRPISNLNFVSKIVEQIVASRFDEHVKTQLLLPDRQPACRATYSTETAVVTLHDAIVRAIDSGEECAHVLLNLKFSILYCRPQHIAARNESALWSRWLSSCLVWLIPRQSNPSFSLRHTAVCTSHS